MKRDMLVIRADANQQMGAGHVMRCLALAQEWQAAGGEVVFAAAEITSAVRQRVEEEGFEVVQLSCEASSTGDVRATLAVVRGVGADWLVLDGYHFGASYRRGVRRGGARVLSIYDGGKVTARGADVVLQPGPAGFAGRPAELFPRKRWIGGMRYLLLRRDLVALRETGRPCAQTVDRVLLTFGGGDDRGMVGRSLRAIERVAPDAFVRVLSSDRVEVPQTSLGVRVIPYGRDVGEHFSWADLAISGAGGTCFELALLGVPSILVAMADNQLPNAQFAEECGFAGYAGKASEVTEDSLAEMLALMVHDRELREDMRRHGQEEVQGSGANRVMRAMKSMGLWLRRVTEDDCELLFQWANDPDVRAHSVSSEPKSWEAHQASFHGTLQDPGSLMLLGGADGRPVGVVRFAGNQGEATISISVAKEARGRGYGTALLAGGIDLARFGWYSYPLRVFHAYIKDGHQASERTFAAVGFRRTGPTVVHGCAVNHWIWTEEERCDEDE